MRHFKNRGRSSSEHRRPEPRSRRTPNSGATPDSRQKLDFLRARSQTVLSFKIAGRAGGRVSAGSVMSAAGGSQQHASSSSFLRGHRPQISNEIVKVTIGHGRIKWEAHRRLKLGPVFALAPRDGALDLRIGPGANALLLVRGDVARHRHAKGPFE